MLADTYSSAIRGAKNESMKFQNQLVALPRAMAFGLTRRGNDSPRYTHGTGPQKREKEKTCRIAKAMRTSPPCLFRGDNSEDGVPVGARVKCPTRPALYHHEKEFGHHGREATYDDGTYGFENSAGKQ